LPEPDRQIPSAASVRVVGRSGVALARRAALALIFAYRATLSPLLGAHCRFAPSCSSYMEESIRRYGLLRGVWRGLLRVGRCHPFHPGGFDPVP
jgi:hypothetical protein